MDAINDSVAALLAALGPTVVHLPESFGTRSFADWSGVPSAMPVALLTPRDTAEVSTAMRICAEHGQPVVPQGGLTGLAGGACLTGGEVAMSLERMNKVEKIDTVSATMVVGAGTPLQVVQEAAAAAGLFFPLDLGARGSCTIGGNLATNAGGNRVVKYGMARDQVLGIEAVLADGSVVGELHDMIKNNSGYDLKNLLIGSEGTLAVITRAVLRLRAAPGSVATAWCGLPDYRSVTTLLSRAQAALPGGVSVFEVMWPSYFDFVIEKLDYLRAPLAERHAYYVLLESTGANTGTATASSSGALAGTATASATSTIATTTAAGSTEPVSSHADQFEHFLGTMLEEGIVTDAALAASEADALAFWAIRDAPSEYPRLIPKMSAFDISFSIANLGEAADRCAALLKQRWPDCTALFYGHLGDGNLHVVVHIADAPEGTSDAIDEVVYDLTRQLHGAISAEHGVGVKKRAYLGHTRSTPDLLAMRAIKHSLDAGDILNRGKVFLPSI
ncbi:MAG: FAD-linked oxidase [Rhizobacter sp.]|nr:FAD-linked oxidase [Rhizobacter sp.]